MWLTGLSGAGKTTLANALCARLRSLGRPAHVLDGDLLRRGLSADLGFSATDRAEQVRRVGEVAQLFVDAGVIPIVSLVSPRRSDRDRVRSRLGDAVFVEVFVNAPLEVCEGRDVKGLYRRARRGEITDFTGLGSPYEAPSAPSIELRTDRLPVEECTALLLDHILKRVGP